MKKPEHEVLTFDNCGGYKITKKRFWLVSGMRDAYGKNICEGDRVYSCDVSFTFTVNFNGNEFVLTDRLGAVEGNLSDFDCSRLEIVGHITEDEK